MYEKDGEKYFIVDSHMHYWDASPENWVQGAEQYAKGWIECFHAYQGLGPAETHQPIEEFQKVSEEQLMREEFEEGHVDVAIFQSTYLREWYKNGFNTTEQNGALFKKHPDKFRVNSRFDPRDGDAGMREFEANVEGHEYDDYPRLGVDGKKKILGLNAAKLYDIEVPAECQISPESSAPASPDDAELVEDRAVAQA
jgi:hypothetical protein